MKKTLLTLSAIFVFLLSMGLASTAFAHGKQVITHYPPAIKGKPNREATGMIVSCHALDVHRAHGDDIETSDECDHSHGPNE